MDDTVTGDRTELASQIADRAEALRAIAATRGPLIAASAPRVIAAAVQQLADESAALLPSAMARGPMVGLSPQMVREGIRNLSESIDAASLGHLVDRLHHTAGSATILPPRVVFHVLAGNLFVSGIESMIHASLAGACSLVRCSSADTVFPGLWRDALAKVDPEFAESVAVCNWPAGDESATRCAIDAADCIIVSGDDSSVAAVRSLTPPFKRFVAHGFKFSFALIGRDALCPNDIHRLAEDLAYDFSVYDQQGCLSPRVAFIETGGAVQPDSFASALADAMRRLAGTLPRHTLDLDEKASLAGARDDVLIRAAAGDSCRIASLPDDEFLVTMDSPREFRLGSLNRHCDLRVFSEADEIRDAMAPHIGHISTISLAGDCERWCRLCHGLRVSRVCPVGRMQRPPLGWIHDGGLPLASLMDFCGHEFH